MKNDLKQIRYEADVLCIGGGIAGLMAAISAAESGARVIVAEKANTLHSGSGGTGNDHFRCYIPAFHGTDIEPLVEEVKNSQAGNGRTTNAVRLWMQKSFDIVKLWDSWGIPMKYNGSWEFAGHAFPGHPFTALKYSGQQQKPILTRVARQKGVEIINRAVVFDLIHQDGCVTGAIGLDAQQSRILEFSARSVILSTGGCVRLYPAITPGWNFNRANCPASTGDGRAMAYRAGAELVNIELPQRWAGPSYFARCGKATWVGVIRDPQGNAVGPFVDKPDRKYGDAIADVYHSLFEDYNKQNKGPIYMDCRGASDEDIHYMTYFLAQEGNVALLNHLKEDGIDLQKNAIMFDTYEQTTAGGIRYNEKGETSIKGLYAAGDEYFGGISAAAVFGWLAGVSAAQYAKQLSGSDITGHKVPDQLMQMLNREDGINWQEANAALQQVMQDFAGGVRSETMLEAGLSHLRRIKSKALKTLAAHNTHELMRSLEVLNLFDIGELVFVAARERKETRGAFIRSDFPYSNPVLSGKSLICKQVNGELVTEWRTTKG
jgi:succinate dehydrogenase/fumarate reductase flavoprotein subunit